VSAIPGTDGGNAPFFSPDGHWIGFNGRAGLMKVRAEGGRPLAITRANFGGAEWLTDGTVIYTPIYTEGLFRISADGRGARRLTTPDRARGELGHWWPDVLPGDRFVIFTAPRTPIDRSRVEVLDLQTHEVTVIVDGGFFGRYAATGRLLYIKGRRLFAQPFDPANARPTGAAVVLLDDVFTNDENACASFAVSNRGALAYIAEAVGNPPRELVWLDREGRRTPATSERRAYGSVSLSSDGRRAAVTLSEENPDLWTVSDRGTLSRETTSAISEAYPKWSRDDRELFYVVSTPDHPNYELYRMDVGKPDSGRPIWDDHVGVDTFQIAVSPDGRTLAFVRQEPETGRNIYTRPLDGSAPARAFRATRAEEQSPSFSPDGRWIAYESDETGRPEIYVDPFGASGEHMQITSDGGTEPVWAAQSREIFYRAGDEIRVVPTRLAKGFEFDAPQRFLRVVAAGETRGMFDVTPDGKRILAATIPEESRPRQINLLLDWATTVARENR
jgi:serine/threonine-protein kinase